MLSGLPISRSPHPGRGCFTSPKVTAKSKCQEGIILCRYLGLEAAPIELSLSLGKTNAAIGDRIRCSSQQGTYAVIVCISGPKSNKAPTFQLSNNISVFSKPASGDEKNFSLPT